MLARTGSDPGFVNCGYLAVGEADREPRIRTAIDAMRSQGVVVEELDNAQIRELEPRLAAGALTIGAYEPTNGVCEPLFVADGFAQRGRAAGSAAVVRHARRPPCGRTARASCCCARTGGASRPSAWPSAAAASGRGSRARSAARCRSISCACRPGASARRSRSGRPGRSSRTTRSASGCGPTATTATTSSARAPTSSAAAPIARAPARAGPTCASWSASSELVATVFPGAARGIFRGSWASWLDFTPDGNPVVDLLPRRPGLLLASGMSGHAFKLCPALGLGASELLLDGEVRSFDWTPFRYGRFDRRHAFAGRGAGGTGTG